MTPWTIYESPLGPLTLVAGRTGLASLQFPGRADPRDESDRRPSAFAAALRQLEEYFAGQRHTFELELDLGGTPFQREVWRRLLEIPYGSTISYTALAQLSGRPDRVRAVAAAVGRTPVPIVVPCHRVVAVDGSLTGYLGGLQRKRALLDLEARAAAGLAPEPAWSFRQLVLL
ncbi:MAG TPA: methylated-DNA--[protein]-cysteine S-methyltransferase [Solirubrobacteraceae bacterium]|nr:methylated-DNA--[protein]-cysteine S-methyltransferase [Solirubrobacteraceae bacterium]